MSLNRPIKKVPSLRDFTVANLFLRTQPGRNCPLNLQRRGYQQMLSISRLRDPPVKKGETFADTVNNILSMKVG